MTRARAKTDQRRLLGALLVVVVAMTAMLFGARQVRAESFYYYYPNCSSATDPSQGCGSSSFNFTGFTDAQFCTASAGTCDNTNPSINVYDQANGAAVPNKFSACWMYVSPNFIPPMDTQSTTDNLGYYTGFSPGSSFQVDHHATSTGCQLSGQQMGAFLNPRTNAVCSGGTCQGGGAIWYYNFQAPRPKPWYDDYPIRDPQGNNPCATSTEWVQYNCPTFRIQTHWKMGRYGVTGSGTGGGSSAAYSNIAASFWDTADGVLLQWQLGVFDTRWPPPTSYGGSNDFILSESSTTYDAVSIAGLNRRYSTLGCSSQNYEQTRQTGSLADWYEVEIPWYQMMYLIGDLNSTFHINLTFDSRLWELQAVNAGIEMIPGPNPQNPSSTLDWVGATAHDMIAVDQLGGSVQGDGSVC